MKNQLLILVFAILLFNTCQTEKASTENYNPYLNPTKFIGKHKAKVSILGTFHFANPAGHDYSEEYEVNILSKQKQAELEVLLSKLEAFRPTKILIERNRISADSSISVQFEQYLDEDFELNQNDEVFQIAFKLGKRLGHQKIYCSDARADWFGPHLDWENFDEDEYLKTKKQYEKTYRYNYDHFDKVEDSLKSVLPLIKFFQLINAPENSLFNHQRYLTQTMLSGAGDHYLGADSVGRWYRRNIRIFANVLDITNFDEEERILVLYGYSHIWTLKQFFNDSPDFDYLEMNEILSD